MAVRILFDEAHNPIQPTIVLTTRSGRRLGRIPAVNVVFKDEMNNGYEMSFKVYQADCKSNWDRITDFKLVWVKEWNRYFEIEVEVSDDGSAMKSVTATSLGKAELSQINLYDRKNEEILFTMYGGMNYVQLQKAYDAAVRSPAVGKSGCREY